MQEFNTLAIILASILTIVLLFAVENLLGMLYFTPTDEIVSNKKMFAEVVAQFPVAFYVAVIILNCCILFIGGTVPIVLGNEKLSSCLLVGVIVLAFMALNAYVIPFPGWYKILSIVLCIPMICTGGVVIKNSFVKLS